MQVQVYIGLGLHCIDVLIYLQYFFKLVSKIFLKYYFTLYFKISFESTFLKVIGKGIQV